MAGEAQVKLLATWASPYAMRVAFALELKGVSYDLLAEDLSNKSQLLLDCNPVHKKVPVLIHNGRPVCESAVIVQYIDEVWQQHKRFMPGDPYARAQARFWGDFIDVKFFRSAAQILRSAKALPRANREFLESCILFEDGCLSKLDNLQDISFVHIVMAPFAVWIPALSLAFGLEIPSPETCPKLHKLFDTILKHPAAKASLPELDKLEPYIRSKFAGREV